MNRNRTLILAVTALILLVAGGLFLWRSEPASETAPATAAPPPPASATDPGSASGPTNSFIVCPGNPRCPKAETNAEGQ